MPKTFTKNHLRLLSEEQQNGYEQCARSCEAELQCMAWIYTPSSFCRLYRWYQTPVSIETKKAFEEGTIFGVPNSRRGIKSGNLVPASTPYAFGVQSDEECAKQCGALADCTVWWREIVTTKCIFGKQARADVEFEPLPSSSAGFPCRGMVKRCCRRYAYS